MKVLFCLPGNGWGGPEREPVRTLMAALSDNSLCELSSIHFSRDVPETVREGNSITVPCRASLSRSMIDLFRIERRTMAGEIRRQNPDLIHVHWTQLGHALAAMDSGIPYVVTVHDAAVTSAYWNWSWYPPSAIATLGGLLIARKVLRRTSHIIAVSPYVAEHVRRYFLPEKTSPAVTSSKESPVANQNLHKLREPQLAPPITLVPNPVAMSTVLGDGGHRYPNAGFFPPAAHFSPTFAAIGHWGPLKRFDLVLNAFHHVRRHLPSAKLVLIGKDLGRGTPCHNWAVRHRLDDGVDFIGFLENSSLHSFLHKQVDCLVHPSRTEGFSLVVADAMAAGIPVIASDAGALPWLLEEGKSGFLMHDGRPQIWAQAMLGIGNSILESGNPETCDFTQIVTSARRRIANLCDPLSVAQSHMKVYEQVLDR